MPIGDLLAEISGDQPSSTPSPRATPSSSGTKRKAESGSDAVTSTKLTRARQPDGSYSSRKVTRDVDGRVVDRSCSVSRSVKTTGSGQTASTNSTTLPHRTGSISTNGGLHASSSTGTQPKRPSEAPSRPRLNPPASAIAKGASSKPIPPTPTGSDPSRAPKKGSFAEIMARGAKVQESMGKVGMIQHKSTDKNTVKKERDIAKPEPKPGGSLGIKGKPGTSYTGTSRPSTTVGRNSGPGGALSRSASRNGPLKDEKKGAKSKSAPAANDVAEKKIKKSATATTGYAGTARPRAGAAAGRGSSSRGDQRPRHGGLLEPPRMSSRRHEEEYDEDLDDFIDYDDEEEPDTGRHYYDSDGSSDMEAGMSDIDTEERRADFFAREEDRREQALEDKLKKEKEERKRRWAQGGR